MFKKRVDSVFYNDRDAEVERGIEVELEPGMVFHVRRAGGLNRNYQNEVSRLMMPLRQRYERGLVDDEELRDKVFVPAYAKTVIIGWSGDAFEDEAGSPVPFTMKSARAFFAEYPDAFAALMHECMNQANFAQADAEEAAADLGNSLSGT